MRHHPTPTQPLAQPRAQSSHAPRALLGLILTALTLVLSLAGCSSVSSSTAIATAAITNTPTPPACATHASMPAQAWVQGQQVMGEINGGPATQLSNFVYPLGFPDEGAVGNTPNPSFIAWAPDAHHLAVAITQFAPFITEYNPYIVDTTTHAVTRVPLAHPIQNATENVPHRIFAWADTHTLIIFEGYQHTGSTYSYDITTNALTPLPHMADHAVEGVVRCSSLYYLSFGSLTPIGGSGGGAASAGNGVLHRYDLTTQSEVGVALTIGQIATFAGAEGATSAMGWDVSPDNTQLAYQQTTAHYSTTDGLFLTSQFYSGGTNALFTSGPSAAHHILNGGPGATSSTEAYMAISPNNLQVAVSSAYGTPNVLSGSLVGGDLRAYSPDAIGEPAWLADSSAFQATAANPDAAPIAIEQYNLSTPLGANGRAPGAYAYPAPYGILPGNLPQ